MMIQQSKLKCVDFASADFEDATIMTDSIKTTDVEEAEGTLDMEDVLKALENMTTQSSELTVHPCMWSRGYVYAWPRYNPS